MKFKIFNYQRRKTQHTYLIEGEGKWSLLDILPYMLKVSKRSRDFAVEYDMGNGAISLVDKRDAERTRSRLNLEKTLDPKINKVRILDRGVGKQMIDKFMRSVEKEDLGS